MDSASSIVNSLNDVSGVINQINQTAEANSARSAEQARIQREWQEVQNAKAMQFNASEAVKSRNWQEYMSNTAHQREVQDLKAAGLNPVLSAMGGNGAAVTSGATASGVTSSGAKGDVDTSMNSALVSILGSMLEYQSKLNVANVNAVSNLAVADKYTEMEKLVESMKISNERFMAENYVSNPWQALSALLHMDKPVSSAYDKFKSVVSDTPVGKVASDVKSVASNLKRVWEDLVTDTVVRHRGEKYRNGKWTYTDER